MVTLYAIYSECQQEFLRFFQLGRTRESVLPTILSRCQIYDFNRISVEDTVAHLAYVASKEGITAEPEALNVIALKADGGMRGLSVTTATR